MKGDERWWDDERVMRESQTKGIRLKVDRKFKKNGSTVLLQNCMSMKEDKFPQWETPVTVKRMYEIPKMISASALFAHSYFYFYVIVIASVACRVLLLVCGGGVRRRLRQGYHATTTHGGAPWLVEYVQVNASLELLYTTF